jgi:CrcB protein
LRYAFVLAFPPHLGEFPNVTFYENLVGSFVLALVLTALLERWPQAARWRAFLCTGMLGSFTTFSTFSLEVFELGANGWRFVASLYAVLSVTGGLCAALSGMLLARRWWVRPQ